MTTSLASFRGQILESLAIFTLKSQIKFCLNIQHIKSHNLFYPISRLNFINDYFYM